MKCPKCGFNSFEYYGSCKKCSNDLTGYKQTYSISSMVLPLEAKEILATEFLTPEGGTDQASDSAEIHDDIFSFDLPEDSSSTTTQRNDNPFSANKPSPDLNQSSNTKIDDNTFADLLESTSQAEESPFSAMRTTATPAPAPAKAAAGEFDLESFSWDDTTADTTAADSKDALDDFDSLFGDTTDKKSK